MTQNRGIFGDIAVAFFGDPPKPKWYDRTRRHLRTIAIATTELCLCALASWACIVAAIQLGRTL